MVRNEIEWRKWIKNLFLWLLASRWNVINPSVRFRRNKQKSSTNGWKLMRQADNLLIAITIARSKKYSRRATKVNIYIGLFRIPDEKRTFRRTEIWVVNFGAANKRLVSVRSRPLFSVLWIYKTCRFFFLRFLITYFFTEMIRAVDYLLSNKY